MLCLIVVSLSPGDNQFALKINNNKKWNYIWLLCLCIQIFLKYRLEKLIPEDRTHGSQEADGTWSGIVGMVASGRADIGLNLMSITKSRLAVVHYVQPISSSR
jgi:hypothetical protein